MGIKIDIKIDLSPTQKRIIRGAVVLGSVIAALGVGIAIAAPHQWKANDPLAAADLNSLNVVSYTGDGGASSYSTGATKFCGITPVTTTGAIVYSGVGGYRGTKLACENVASCGNSPTAHMCTTEEMIRSSALGMTTANGWIASGVGNADCLGWKDDTIQKSGAAWDTTFMGGGGVANLLSCNATTPILCCD